MRKYWPMWILVAVYGLIFGELIWQDKIAAPMDTLAGSYYPWLDSKWGYLVGVPVKNGLLSDVFSQFYLWKTKASEIMGWNPYVFAGTPGMATYHAAVFFPGNIVLALPGRWGWNMYIAASTVAAGLGMWFLSGEYVKSVRARLAAAIIFSLAGPMTTWAEFGTGVWAAAGLVWAVYLAKKNLVAMAMVIGATLLAGHVQLATYMLIILPLYIWREDKANIKNKIAKIVMLGLGVGLAAFQLVPTVSLYKDSIRGLEKYATDFNFGLSKPEELIRLWMADFYGNPVTGNYWSRLSYHEYSNYLGAISLPLIGYLVIAHWKKVNKFWLAAGGVSLILAYDNVVARVVWQLPIPLLTYSSASRVFFVTGLAAALLVAQAMEQIEERKDSRLGWVMAGCVVVTGLVWLAVPAEHRLVSLRNSVLGVGMMVGVGMVSRVKIDRRVVTAVMVIMLALDLARYYKKYNPFAEARLTFPDTGVTTFLSQQPKPFRIAKTTTNLLPPNTWMHYGIEAIEGYDPLRLLRYNQLFLRLNKSSVHNRPSRYSELESKIDKKVLDGLDVQYIVATKPGISWQTDLQMEQLGEEMMPVFEEGSVVVYWNEANLGRVYIPAQVQLVENKLAAEAAVDNVGFDPKQLVVIEQGGKEIMPNGIGKVKISSYATNRLTLESNTEQVTWIVVANAYDQGWRASVDGETTKVYAANLGLQAINVPGGRHEVQLTYEPVGWRVGWGISIVSAVALGGTEGLRRIRARRRRPLGEEG